MKVVYKSETAKRSQMKPKGNWEFQGRKVRVLSEESWSFLSPKSRYRKSAEKGRLWMLKSVVNFVDRSICGCSCVPAVASDQRSSADHSWPLLTGGELRLWVRRVGR